MTEQIEKSGAVKLAVVTSTAGRSLVVESRKFDITEHGEVVFHGEMGFDEFQEVLVGMKRVNDKYHLILASMVRYGIKSYGKERVDAALSQLEFQHLDALRAMSIGQLTLEFSENPSLEPDHYWVLATLFEGKPKEQARWAALAEQHGLTASELKISIEKGAVTRQAAVAKSSGRGSGGLGSFEAFEVYFSQFERRIGGEETLLSADRAVKEKFLETTNHVQELRDKVRATLEGVE